MGVNVIFTLGMGSTAEGITKVANDESVDFIFVIGGTEVLISRAKTIKQN